MALLSIVGRFIHRLRDRVHRFLRSGSTRHTPGRNAPVRRIELDVIPDEIDPENDETIPVEVRLPQDLNELVQSNPSYLGSRDAFDIDRDEEGRITAVAISEAVEDGGLAAPVGRRSVAGHEGHWILTFRVSDIDTSNEEGGTVTMGLFVVGREQMWGTDSVSIPPRGRDK